MSMSWPAFEELRARQHASARIGVFGCGYWHQFPGLRERLVAHQSYFEQRLRERGMTVVSGGLVDSPQVAVQVGDRFRREGIDFLICFVSTYALSSTVLPVVQRVGVPLLIASLQPSKAMDYEHDNQTSLCWGVECVDVTAPGYGRARYVR